MSTICLDFDGVLHSYTSGWQGADTIPDDPVPESQKAVAELIEMGYEVAVHSSRCSQEGGMFAMGAWLDKHGFPQQSQRFKVVADKPPAMLYVDDRGYRFDGVWNELLYGLENDPHFLTPWNKR